MSEEPAASSVFQSTLPITAKLERARLELLDLSARNRLLICRALRERSRLSRSVDEKSLRFTDFSCARAVRSHSCRPEHRSRIRKAIPKKFRNCPPDDDSVDETRRSEPAFGHEAADALTLPVSEKTCSILRRRSDA